MVQVKCDRCGKVRPENSRGTEWILGYDLQSETPSSVQRAIRFLDHWEDRRVLELGAIHLCSEACKDAYVRRSKAA